MTKTAKTTQSKRFEQVARELGCDDDPERFADRVRQVAKTPPQHHPSTGSPPKSRASSSRAVSMEERPMKVSELEINDKSMGLIVRSLALEVHKFCLSSGVFSHSVEDQLPLVFSVLDRHLSDLIDFCDIPAGGASGFAGLVIRFSEKGYRTIAEAAKNRVTDLVD